MSNTGDGKKLATFNIEGEVWDAFKTKARENGANASALLNQWIKSYLDDLDELPDNNLGNTQVNEVQSVSEESLIERILPSLTQKIRAEIEHDLGGLVNTLIDANLPAAIEAHAGKA